MRVVAELAASRPDVPLARLADELTDPGSRLDLLDAGGDPGTQVRAVFSWSCRYLDAEAARTFRLLGMNSGADVEPYAAAALTGTTVRQARRALDELARAHLIQAAGPGRHGMHDLLRSYARELAATLDTTQEQHAALTRLFDYYLYTAAAAMDILIPAERHRRPRIPRPATPVPRLADSASARAWLDAERAALVAAAGHAAAHGWPGHATRLATTLSSYLHTGGYFPEALTVFGHALSAARRMGDCSAEATAHYLIGNVDGQLNRLQQAADRCRQALALFHATGDRAGEARALSGAGQAEAEMGRYEQSVRCLEEAVAIFRDMGDLLGQARAQGNLGFAWQRQGRYEEAARCQRQALALCREIGDGEGEGYALARLGVTDLLMGHFQDAAGYLEQALALFRDIGSTVGEAENLNRLGDSYLGLGRHEQAARTFERALGMSRGTGDRDIEADAFNGLGEVFLRTGDADKAQAYHATALRLVSEIASPRVQARAHSGAARACQAVGDSAQARRHWQEALIHYAAIGAAEAVEINARLSTAGDDGHNDRKPAEVEARIR